MVQRPFAFAVVMLLIGMIMGLIAPELIDSTFNNARDFFLDIKARQ